MLIFNGLKFAKNDAEMVNSLFAGGNTCAGFYKQIKSGFQLLNLQKELFAFVSPGKGLVVSAARCANGKPRYLFSTCSLDEKYLNLPESYTATIDACKAAKVIECAK